MKISIIIPTYNEASNIRQTLQSLQKFREQGHEIIVVDGGSEDDSLAIAQSLADLAFTGPKGRSAQMNEGAARAKGDILLFLHADTLLPENALELVRSGLNESNRAWGRFNVSLSGSHPMFRIIENLMNWRSCVTSIATGDQGIFVYKNDFDRIGGFAEIPLMEDIELSKRLKKISRPLCITQRLITSSRRWEKYGILRTVILMWRLRLAYFLGASPERLARIYS